MTLSLNEVLTDPAIVQALQEDPASFRFPEAPSVVMTMVPFDSHIVMRNEDYISRAVKEGIPTHYPIYGPMAKMVGVLSASLNFTYKLVVPSDSSWGSRSSNGTWSGMVGQVYRKEVDMGLGPFTTILSRFQAVDMSVPFFFDTLAILSARGSAAINPWGFLMPLTNTVWASFIASLLIVCIIHFLFEHFFQPETSWLKHFGRILFEYVQPPLDHALVRKIWSVWQKPLFGSWVLVSFLMNSSYGGNLKSMMALRYIEHPIQTVRDLIEDTTKKIVIEHRSSYLATVQRVPFGDINELNRVGEAGRYADYPMRDFLSYSHRILSGDHVQVFDTLTSLYYRAKEFSRTGRCEFYLARETFIPFMYSMICQKHSLITPAINARIRKVFEAGLYKLWVSQHIANDTACANPPMKVYLQDPIRLENIWGVAVIWSGGMLLAFSVFAMERVWNKYRTDRDD